MIRPAKFADIPALMTLVREMYGRSKYAARATLDEALAKRLLMSCIQRHGLASDGGTLVLVAEADNENGGKPIGFIVGMLDPLYHLGTELMATDLFFFTSLGAPVSAASGLLDGLIAWAKQNPRVVEVCCGVTDAVADPERTAVLYRRRGMSQTGMIFELRIR